MKINDFFKNLFGFNTDYRTPPFSGEDLGDDEDQYEDDSSGHFIFFDMSRQMESMQREMEEMFKNFGAAEFFPGIQQPDPGIPKNPRDEMLKDKNDKESTPFSTHPHQFLPFKSPFTAKLPITGKKEDLDMDGKLDVDDVAKLFDKQPEMRVETPRSYSYQRSFSLSKSRGPNGRVEERKTVRDADGNEEVTVTRSLGNQSHSVTIKKDKSGNEERIENFNNMDEGEVNKFNNNWDSPQRKSLPETNPDELLKDNYARNRDTSDASLYNKLFGNWFKKD